MAQTTDGDASYWLKVTAAAFAGGLLAAWAGLPGAWLLGSMLAAIAVSWRQARRPRVPAPLEHAAHAALGITLSASIDPASLAVVAANLPLVLFCVIVILGLGIASGLLLARRTGIGRATAVLGMIPGGASAMVAMSGELKADVRLVAFMQYLRVIFIVVLASAGTPLLQQALGDAQPAGPAPAALPADVWRAAAWLRYGQTALLGLAGLWIGRILRLPAATTLGPLLVGAAAGISGLVQLGWPPGTLPLVYALLGIGTAQQFDAAALHQIRRLLPALIATVVALLVCCTLLGLGLAALTRLDLLSSMLATVPGGLDAIAIAALDSRGNIALIMGVQITRLLAMVILAPFFVRWLSRAGQRAEPGSDW